MANTWEDRMSPRPKRNPRLELLETCWRFMGPSKCAITCEIYSVETGFEVRVGYSLEDPISTQVRGSLNEARHLATTLKQAVIDKGGFEELPV